ncbi:MAG: hypothetical protein ACREXS_19755 [Gammaproteobacteria bacterium]
MNIDWSRVKASISRFGSTAPLTWLASSSFTFIAGWFLIFVAGYLLSYQLFFTAMPVERLGKMNGGKRVDFIYEGVAYFHGVELRLGEAVQVTYSAPTLARIGRPKIEFFVEVPAAPKSGDGEKIAQLRIEQTPSKKQDFIPIQNIRNQRFTIVWAPRPYANNRLSVTFEPEPNASAAQAPGSVVIATNIVDFSTWPYVGLTLALGMTALLVSYGRSLGAQSAPQRYILAAKSIMFFLGPILVMYFFHSGAIISNDFFPNGHGKMSALSHQLLYLGKHGHLGQKSYRSAGSVLIPAFSLIIEGRPAALSRIFSEVYPTSRYAMFAVTATSFALLATAMRQFFNVRVALIFFVLAGTFFPFIVDLYYPDIDAYFIFLFPPFCALLMRILQRQGPELWNYGLMLALLAVMGTVKVSPAFLIIATPLALAVFYYQQGFLKFDRGYRSALAAFSLLFFAFFVSFSTGSKFAALLEHPDRNVGIEGEPFQDFLGWHMIWAAYGLYDRDSAHGFTKLGGLRNKRVSEATGLPITTYLRHSQSATDKVYKPQVINAFEERPGYFYSTAFLRLYNHGLKFFRYSYGGDVWNKWLSDGVRKPIVVSGQTVRDLKPERNAIRYGEAWKISPLGLLAKLTQKDITFLADLLLLSGAIAGLFLIRSRPLMIFMILTVLAELVFSSLVHGINRYFMFCGIALLLGLSLILDRLRSLIYSTSLRDSDTLAVGLERRE